MFILFLSLLLGLDADCPEKKPKVLQDRKKSDMQRSSPALLTLEPVLAHRTPFTLSTKTSDDGHPAPPNVVSQEAVFLASIPPQSVDCIEPRTQNQQPRRPHLPQQNLSLTSPVSTTTPLSPSSRTFSSPGYSDEPMSAGQRRAHWRYFNANSHPQSSNCDNNLSMTSDMGVGGGRGGHLYRHASYPLTGQHLMTCINIDSPDDNNANLSPPPTLSNSSGRALNNNDINSNNYLDNMSSGNRQNNNIDTDNVETHPRLSARSFDPHFEGEEEEEEGVGEEEESNEGNNEEHEDGGRRKSCDNISKDWSLKKESENVIKTHSFSPTHIKKETSGDKRKPDENRGFVVGEEGDQSSHKGSSTSGLSSSPSSSGSLSEPHLLKSSPSSDLVVQHKSHRQSQGQGESHGSQVSEEMKSQSQSLYETAESLADDSDSCGGQDPLSPFSPAVSDDNNSDSQQQSHMLVQQQEHTNQGIRFNFEPERQSVKANDKSDFHPF